MQIVARHPEMPNELELNREDRQQLAELMPEYPTEQGNQDEENKKRSSADSAHAYDASGRSKTPIGKKNAADTLQNADKYVGKKYSSANAKNATEIFDHQKSYENNDNIYAPPRAGIRQCQEIHTKEMPTKQ